MITPGSELMLSEMTPRYGTSLAYGMRAAVHSSARSPFPACGHDHHLNRTGTIFDHAITHHLNTSHLQQGSPAQMTASLSTRQGSPSLPRGISNRRVEAISAPRLRGAGSHPGFAGSNPAGCIK